MEKKNLNRLNLKGDKITVVMANGERFHNLSYVSDEESFSFWLRESKQKIFINNDRIEAILI